MKPIHQIFLLFTSALLLASCNKIMQDVDVPPSEPQIAVQAHINPIDCMVVVSVSFSKPVFNKPASPEPDYVSNAIVDVKCGQNTISLVYDAAKKHYKGLAAPLQLGVNKSVKVSVRVPGYHTTDGSTLIPKRANTSLEVVSISNYSSEGYTAKRAQIKFRDIAGEENYYRIFAVEEKGASTFVQPAYVIVGREYTSDAGKDGEEIITTFQYSSEPGTRLKVFLLTTDKSYYQYHSALENYTSENPFGEPSMIPTNINNGLGMITSYLSYSKYAN